MKDVHPLWGLLVFAVVVIVNSILYSFVTAIEEINDSDIEGAENNGEKVKDVMEFLERPARFKNTLKIITVIIDIAVGALLLSWFSKSIVSFGFFKSNILATCVVVILLFVILEVFGIMVPSMLAKKKPRKYIFRYLTTIKVLQTLFAPITCIILAMSNIIVRILGVDPNSLEDNVTEEEIIDMVNEGHEQGVILESEAQMITNIFEFGDKQASDVMTHRKNIVALDGNTTLEKAVMTFLNEGLSRIPVYEEDIDNIVGILHFKDAFREYGSQNKRKLTILAYKEMMYDAHLIPETRSINTLFKEMQSDKIHMSIVIDEYGQTIGLVTMEDIIEEIFGNIFDEHDADNDNIEQKSENLYEVDGLTPLEELEELLGIEFEEEEFDTLNGLLISKLGRIPEDQEDFELDYKNCNFKILSVEKNMITKVRIVLNDKNTKTE